MSFTLLSGPAPAEEVPPVAAPSRPERFRRSDFIAGGIVAAITLGVYVATLAPGVTLEDSGELITGAAAFGVPHPPGYPLWTISGFLFSHLFPFGNMAWRINLLSALFGAAANGICAMLVAHSGRWLLQRWAPETLQALAPRFSFHAGLLAGLVLGFSDVMWGQAVIAEVYTLNALFVNLVLLLFYRWMLEPLKTRRLIVAVLAFALGLTNHHTLIQIIPAFLIAALLVWKGKFWSVLTSVNLFSLSILVYLSWLSDDAELHRVSEKMAVFIFALTALAAFISLRRFRWRAFLAGAACVLAVFAYGHWFLSAGETATARSWNFAAPFWHWGRFVEPGWLQITRFHGLLLLLLGMASAGLYFTSQLDRRMVLGVFAVGWLGLMPYAYESFASGTHPPMNWGVPEERAGFYYAVTRQQYPMNLPGLIKDTLGKLIGAVPRAENADTGLGRPDYGHRLWLTLYYYADNLVDNFTVPLLFLPLAGLIFLRRCDWPQVAWLVFLGVAFFTLGFMLHLIEPQESFDFERNLQYKVFHLQSHCIFALFVGYGALAALLHTADAWPETTRRFGPALLGFGALIPALLPLYSNFDDCNQAGHDFGHRFGADTMRGMDRNAVFFGGSDAGRFVPTYMAFIESQQPDRWKIEPGFDRRDVAVITQNALCDTYYARYIRDQYDPRFRPRPEEWTPLERRLGRDRAYPEVPVTCVSPAELAACWTEYETANAERIRQSGQVLRPNTSDVYELDGVVAKKIFEANKKDHTFYLEQSLPIQWMYPYLLPDGLIFKFNPEPMDRLPDGAVEADRRYWDAYAARLLRDPKFHLDDDARLVFGKLAMWHADLYRWRKLDAEQEYWLKLALALCPQLETAVDTLAKFYAEQHRYAEAIAVIRQGQAADPRNEYYAVLLAWLTRAQVAAAQPQAAPLLPGQVALTHTSGPPEAASAAAPAAGSLKKPAAMAERKKAQGKG